MLQAAFEGALDGYIWLIWTVVATVGAWWALVLCFYAVMYAKMLIEKGAQFNWFFLGPIYVGFVVGLVLDVLFNWLVGTLIYREWAQEPTFTSRCKRHKEKGESDWRGRKAIWWCDQLNKIEAAHC